MSEQKATGGQQRQQPRPQLSKTAPKKATSSVPGKEKKKASGGLIFAFVLILLMGGCIAAIYLNVAGSKSIVANALGIQTQTQTELAAIQDKTDALDKREAELQATEKTLKNTQSDLDKRQSELDGLQTQLNTLQEQLNAQQATLDGQQADMDKIVAAFEKMDAANAALIISGLGSSADMIRIINQVSDEVAAGILENMDPVLAAQILSETMQ